MMKKQRYKRIRQKKYQQDYRNKLKESKEPKPIKEVGKTPLNLKKKLLLLNLNGLPI